MRSRLFVVIAGAAVLAAVLATGCGTVQAPAGALTAAVANTSATTSRVMLSTTMSSPGMTTTITATGEFDYAHARGVLVMGGTSAAGGMGVQVLYLPPQLYVNLGDIGQPFPAGKKWIDISLPSQTADASLAMLPMGDVNATPTDLLAALSSIASNVTDLGSATIRGVAVTHYRVIVDLARAEAHLRPQASAEFHAFVATLASTRLPVDVWVDAQARVNRITISLPMPPGSGTAPSFRVSETVDFYDFGVPVQISPPPPSEIMSASQFSTSMSSSDISGTPAPPPVSGTMSAAQTTAAEQAISAFWTAVSTNSAQAVEQTVVPSQRNCVAGFLQGSGFHFKVSALHITAAKPAGTGKAAVWFTVNATVQIDGQTVPMSPSGAAGGNWLLATEIGNVWYADLSNSGSGVFPPCGP